VVLCLGKTRMTTFVLILLGFGRLGAVPPSYSCPAAHDVEGIKDIYSSLWVHMRKRHWIHTQAHM
jgi:hypothetical protein